MGPMLSMAAKDLRLLLRDRVGLFFVLVFPMVYGMFFGLIFSGAGGDSGPLTVLVADLDGSEASGRLVERLDAHELVAVERVESRDAAVAAVRAGRRPACIVIPEGFGEKGMFTGTPATVELGVDPARKAEAGMLQGVLMETAFQGMQDLFTDPGAMNAQLDKALASIDQDNAMPAETRTALEGFLGDTRKFMTTMDEQSSGDGEGAAAASDAMGAAMTPVVIEPLTIEKRASNGPENAFAITFPQAAVWGVLGAAAGFGISLVQERTGGTLSRLRIAPSPRWHVLGGKALACAATVFLVIGMVLAMSVVVFGLRPGSWPLLGLAALCVAACFVGLMMLLASIARTEQAAGGIGWAVLVVCAMLGGGMIPLFLMPSWMQRIGSVSPVKWAILALEGAVWRGYTLPQMLVPCGVLLAIGAAAFAVGGAVFSRRAAV